LSGLLALCLLAGAVASHADSLTWGIGGAGGAGTWNLNATANWYDGTSNVQWKDNSATGTNTAIFSGAAGTVTLNTSLSAANLQFIIPGYTLSGSGTLTLGAGGIDTSALGSGTTTIGNALTLAGGQQLWQSGSGGILAVNGVITRGVGAAVDFSATGITSSTLANDAGGILGGWATVGGANGTGGDWAANDGSGNIITYTGYTLVTGSNDITGALTQNWKTTANTVLTNSATINSLSQLNDFTVNSGVTLTLGSGGLILGNISRWMTAGSTTTSFLTSGFSTGELFVHVPDTGSGNNWRIWPLIKDNGATAVRLIKDGAGYVALANNNNTYSGGTLVNAGILGASETVAAPATISPFGPGTVTVNGGQLQLGTSPTSNNGAYTYTNDITVNGATLNVWDSAPHLQGALTIGAAGATVGTTFNGGGGELDKGLFIDGIMGGSGNVTVQHSGLNTGNAWNTSIVFITNNANTYSGTITVIPMSGANGGSYLGVNGNTALANATIDLSNGNNTSATLRFGNSPLVFKTGIGTAALGALTGSADVVLTGYNAAGNPHAYGTDPITLVVGNNGLSTTYSGILSGLGGLTKVGAGTLTLSSANTYTGNTVVNGGSLVLSGGSLSSTNYSVASGATFDVTASALGSLTLTGDQTLASGGTVIGAVNTTSGSKIYAGTDGGYGTNKLNNDLTLATGAQVNFDLGTLSNGSNDLITVAGTLTANNNIIHIKAPSTSDSLQAADYVLITSPNPISGSFAAAPTWDVAPVNAAHYSIVMGANTVTLHYSAVAGPTGVGSATPSPALRNQNVLITVTTTDGTGGTVNSVTVDASPIGGSSTLALVSAGGHVWTNTVTVSANTPAGNTLLVVSLTDTVLLTSSVNIPLTITTANDVWDGLAANDLFSSNLNWTNQLAPGYVGDSLQFAGTTRLTPSMDNNYTVSGVTFDSTAGSFNVGTANGSTLTLAGGLTNNSVNPQTLSVPMTLSAVQTINAAAANIALGGVITGAGGISKTGTNALTLSATGNSLTGITRVLGGTVNITGGSTALGTGRSDVGYRAASGNLAISGGSFTTGGDLGVGYSDQNGTANNATGTVTVANANVSLGGRLIVGRGNNNQNTVSGTVTLNSGSTLSCEGDILLGYAGNNNLGKVVVNGGTLNIASTIIRWVILGQWDTSDSEIDINSGQMNINGSTAIRFAISGNTGTNTFNLNGGAVTFYSDNATTVGGSGVLDLHQGNGSTVVNTFNLNGGTLTVPAVTSANVAGSRTFNFNGGALVAAAASSPFMNLGTGNAVANVRNGGAIIDDAGFTISIDQALLHSTIPGDNAADGGLTKSGAGTLTLTAVNTYNGATKINAGTLALSGSASINNSTNIIVGNGAIFDVSGVSYTLGGGQSLLGSGNNSGFVNTSAGSKIFAGTDGGYGTNTFNSDLTLVSGAGVYLDLGTTVSGSNDQVVVAGTLTVNNNTLHIKAPSTSASLDAAADYVLITAGAISGTFATAPIWDVAPANAGHYTVVTSGNTVKLHYDASANAPLVTKTSANPASALRNGTTLLTATITPGGAPISTVTVDLSALGGSTVSLVQSNSSSVYTNTITIPPTASAGSLTLTVTVTDSASATGSAGLPLTVATSSEVWSGGGANQNWSTNPNWLSGSAPGYAGDGIVFAGALGLASNMDNSYSVTGVTFSNNASSFTIGSGNGSMLTLSANGLVNNSANAQTVNVPVVLAAPQTINAAAGNVTLSQTLDNGGSLLTVSGAANTTVSGAINGEGGLTKTGNGTLTLAGDNTFNGVATVNGGMVTLTGTITSPVLDSVGSTAGSAVLNIAGGNLVETYNPANIWDSSFNLGTAAGAAGVVRMSSGTFTSPKQLAVGTGNSGGYAAFSQSGGLTTIGGFLAVGGSAIGGVFNQSGGTVEMTGAPVTLGYNLTTARAVMNLSGTAVFNMAGAGNGLWPGEVGTGILNVSGNAQLNITNAGIDLGHGNALGSGTVNLLGGVTTVNLVSKNTGSGTLNFNGGTLRANVASGSLVGGLDGAYIYSGGATIDDGGLSVTIPQALLAPAGYGVVSIPVSNGGSGYIDTPVVTITNISASGSGATAVANVSGGVITSITVTSPGHDYGSGDTLGVAVVGGGGSGAVIGAPVLGANTGGGLTKQGIGTLTLSGANTYAGNTTVSAGTLEIVNPVLAAASTVSVASGATLQLDFSVTNTVTGLVLNGVSQPTGVYNTTTSPTYITGTGSLLVGIPIASNPTNITFSVSGSTLSLSWPADHLGWLLQSQTNSLSTGISTNWFDVPGSASSTSAVINMNPANATVFYRLRHP